MDFTYLDKESYKDIHLYDESRMTGSDDSLFYIRKYKATNKNHALHRHQYIQINYVSKGSGIHYINDKSFDVYKGDIFIIPPYVPHKISSKDSVDMEIIEFEFSPSFILPDLGNSDDLQSISDFAYLAPFMVIEEKVRPRFNLEGKLREDVENLLSEALEEYKFKNSGYALVIKALLLRLLVITGRAYSGVIKGTETEKILNKHKKVISSSREYIDKNYSENITLNDISKKVNYSKSHFSYLFKAVIGQTFIEYLNRVRIEKAIELLENTDKSITDIAYEVGFNSIANFNKNFKIITGNTPRKYR